MQIDIKNDIQKIINIVIGSTVRILNENKIKKTKADVITSFDFSVRGYDIYVEIPAHYIYVEKGRKPNSNKPPVRAIYDWLKKEKIRIPDGLTAKSFAYAVRNSIGKKGIKPRPFIKDLQDDIAILTRDYVVNIINKKIK
jgi:hypothetical protein